MIMKKLAAGCILIVLNIYIYIGNAVLGLLPDFAGYILISNALVEMTKTYSLPYKEENIVFAACVFAGIRWTLDLSTLSVKIYNNFGTVWNIILNGISIVFLAIVTYAVMNIIAAKEKQDRADYDLKPMNISWCALIFAQVLQLFSAIMPVLARFSILFGAMSFAFGFWYAVMVYFAMEKIEYS